MLKFLFHTLKFNKNIKNPNLKLEWIGGVNIKSIKLK